MRFTSKTRKLTSPTGYIRRLDGTLYSDHAIYLGCGDSPDNYGEGDKAGYEAWLDDREDAE